MSGLPAIARQLLDAYNAHDSEAFCARSAVDVEWSAALAAGVENKIFRGHDGIRQYFVEMDAVFSEYAVLVDEFIDLGGGRVLGLGRVEARGAASGVEVNSEFGLVGEFDGGLARRVTAYLSHRSARDAAGL